MSKYTNELKEIFPTAVRLRNVRSFHLYNKYIYSFVREKKPEIFVESGVAGGATSYCILEAMKRNDRGYLYSFDPGHEYVEDESHIGLGDAEYKNYEPGELIPSNLKNRWTFTKSKFLDKAEKVLKNHRGKVDVFFHDSDHSEENINNEFKLMENYVKPDGYFLIHDPITDYIRKNYKLLRQANENSSSEKYSLKVFSRQN